MAYDFQKLSEVEPQDKPTENTTVMAFDGGVPKQIPAGEFGGKGYVLKPTADEITQDESSRNIITTNYDELLKVLEHGGIVWVVLPTEFTGYPVLSTELVCGWFYEPKDIASEGGFDSACLNLLTFNSDLYLTNGSYIPNL